jgi:hypothetical protein
LVLFFPKGAIGWHYGIAGDFQRNAITDLGLELIGQGSVQYDLLIPGSRRRLDRSQRPEVLFDPQERQFRHSLGGDLTLVLLRTILVLGDDRLNPKKSAKRPVVGARFGSLKCRLIEPSRGQYHSLDRTDAIQCYML